MNRKLVTVFVTLLGLGVFSSAANAQFLVKRIKCADLAMSAHQVFYNPTASPVNIIFQVIKDGCRPKGNGGYFELFDMTFGGVGTGNLFPRIGKGAGKPTLGVIVTISPSQYAGLRFFPLGGEKVSGTLDYMYTIQ